MILVNCSCCDVEYSRTRKQVNVVTKRSGKWTCRKCCAVAHGIAQSLPIGSDRVHKQSGYIEVKTADGWRRQHMVVMASIGVFTLFLALIGLAMQIPSEWVEVVLLAVKGTV